MGAVVKLCSFAGCHVLVRGRGYCARHRNIRSRTYGAEHRKTRRAVFEAAGWRCHYCGKPVTMSDDVAHLSPTQQMSPAQAWAAPKVPAHRSCHNANAPHLRGEAAVVAKGGINKDAAKEIARQFWASVRVPAPQDE